MNVRMPSSLTQSTQLRGQRWHIWFAALSARPYRRWFLLQREPRGATDESRRHQSASQATPGAKAARFASSRQRAEFAGPVVSSEKPKTEMGGGLYLLTLVRAGCCCCRRGPVLAACGRLVNATDDDSAVSDGCPANGYLPSSPALRSAASFGPRLPVHKRGLERLLESHRIVCSMSRRSNCWHNAAMESFFSTERLSKSTTGPGMIHALTCSTI
jgi:hypothetical protein